jgi:uncharacterized protein YjbI with pentapeptide repeats
MSKAELVAVLRSSAENWNAWRVGHYGEVIDLSGTDLQGAQLSGANFIGTNLRDANIEGAKLVGALFDQVDLSNANLCGCDFWQASLRHATLEGALLDRARFFEADLHGAILRRASMERSTLVNANLEFVDLSDALLTGADFTGANLHDANLARVQAAESDFTMASLYKANLEDANLTDAWLGGANLNRANLSNAILKGADLSGASANHTVLDGADLSDCRVFGTSAWRIVVNTATKQNNLIITQTTEPTVTIDNIKIAQFVYLLLNNEEIRGVVDTLTSKTVLILGRFTPERKVVLDRLREELRAHNYLPVVFDFDKPISRTLTETVATLGHMSRFIIADISEPRSIPQELQRLVPGLPSVPVQPLLQASEGEWGMFQDLLAYPWVLPPFRYETLDHLVAGLYEHVLGPAETMAQKVRLRMEERQAALHQARAEQGPGAG